MIATMIEYVEPKGPVRAAYALMLTAGLALAMTVENEAAVIPPEPSPAHFTGTECVALAIFAEARSETVRGQRLVAHVIRNRAERTEWADSPCDVVVEPGQFVAIEDWDPPRDPESIDAKAWDAAVSAARDVLGETAPPDHCSTATHFWAGRRPAWARDLIVVCQEGAHTFAFEEPR